LANLGFYDGDFAEPLEEKIKSAISEFQAVKNLEVTGKLDSNTKQELFKT
jgi:peptidoglycan hydrolase-like protein with peptidoglycan-binding domain